MNIEIQTHDKNIEEIINNRHSYSNAACIINENEEDINYEMFKKCEKNFFEYFMNKNFDEIKQVLTILPKGSLIFHGIPCRSTNNFPPINPVIGDNNLTAIKLILSEETISKTIGTFMYNQEQEIKDEP